MCVSLCFRALCVLYVSVTRCMFMCVQEGFSAGRAEGEGEASKKLENMKVAAYKYRAKAKVQSAWLYARVRACE